MAMTIYNGQISDYQITVWSSGYANFQIRQLFMHASVPSGQPGAPTLYVNLAFTPSGGRQLTSQVEQVGGQPDFTLYTPVEDYLPTLDLLRNSSDIWIQIDDTDLNTWTLMSNMTNVGQGQVAGAVIPLAPLKLPIFPPRPAIKATLPPLQKPTS
jgi:hypothetical protein